MTIARFFTYFFLTLFTTLSFQSTVLAQQPLPLKTTADSNVETIFNSLVTAFIQKIPGADNTASIQLSSDSVFNNGEILGQFVLNSSPENQTQGQIKTTLTQSGDTAEITVDVQISTTPAFFFNSISNATSTPITSLEAVKEALLNLVNSIETQSGRSRMSFGQPAEASSGFNEDQKALIVTAISTAMQISVVDNTTSLLNFDISQVTGSAANQEAITNLIATAPHLQWLMSLNRLEVRSSADKTEISLRTVSQLPVSIITNYDAYLSSQQQMETGLTSQADLIQAIAPWTVRLCSAADYQQECVDKVLYECSKSQSNIASCVSQAHSLRGLAEARRNGDTLGVITNGADLAVKNAVDWVIGD